jgi:hypothetical protein
LDAASTVTSIPAARPCPFPRSTTQTVPASRGLMVKRSSSLPRPCAGEKANYIRGSGPRSQGAPIHQIWRHRFGGTQQLEEFALPQLTSNGVEFPLWHSQLFLPTVHTLAGSSRSCPGRPKQAPFETRRTPQASPVAELAAGQMMRLIEIVRNARPHGSRERR